MAKRQKSEEIPSTFISSDTLPHPFDAKAIEQLGFLKTNLLGTITMGNDDIYKNIKNTLLEKRVFPTIKNLINRFLPEQFFENFRVSELREKKIYESSADSKNALITRIWEQTEKMAISETDFALGFSLCNSNPADVVLQKKALAQHMAAYVESLEDMLENSATKPGNRKQQTEARKFAMSCAKFTADEIVVGLGEIINAMTIANSQHQNRLKKTQIPPKEQRR